MPTLENFNGASLVPDLGNVSNLIATRVEQGRERERQAEEQAALQQHLETALSTDGGPIGGTPSGQPGRTGNRQQQALARIFAINPQAGNGVIRAIKSRDVQANEKMRADGERGLRNSAFIQSQGSHIDKLKAITALAEGAQARGEPIDQFVRLANMDEDQLDLELRRIEIMSKDLKDLFTTPKAQTDIGRARQDVRAGFITAEEFENLKSGKATAGDFSKSPGFVVSRGDQNFAQIPVLNKNTGQVEMQEVPITGDLVSKLGETGQQQTQRAISEAGGKATAKGQSSRTQGLITTGQAAADQLPVINRTIALLDTVSTGGFANAKFQIQQFLGIEGANEAELSANLGKAVLSQLRSTFGAAFTEREGARLARIEAGFGKSTAGNKRLLGQLQKIVEREARRGIRAAEKDGDNFSANEIREAMGFRLQSGVAKPLPEGVTEQDIQHTMELHGVTREQVIERLR